MIEKVYIGVGILIFCLILDIFLILDMKQWNANTPIRHGKELTKRLPCLLIPAALFALAAHNWWSLGWAMLMMLCYWWEFFDGLFNKRRDKSWRYNGSFNDIGHKDAFTDKILKKLQPYEQTILKWCLITNSTYLYINSINH